MTFPTTLDTDFGTVVDNVDDVLATHINTLRRAVEGIEAKVGIDSSAVTTSLDYKVNNFFASGRKVYLYENTAPTGWSIVSVTDRVLAVKGGTGSYNVNGGNTAGSWSHYHEHNHMWYDDEFKSFNSSGASTTLNCAAYLYDSATQQLWRPFSQNVDLYTNNDSTANTTFRPAACVGIIVQKT